MNNVIIDSNTVGANSSYASGITFFIVNATAIGTSAS